MAHLHSKSSRCNIKQFEAQAAGVDGKCKELGGSTLHDREHLAWFTHTAQHQKATTGSTHSAAHTHGNNHIDITQRARRLALHHTLHASAQGHNNTPQGKAIGTRRSKNRYSHKAHISIKALVNTQKSHHAYHCPQ